MKWQSSPVTSAKAFAKLLERGHGTEQAMKRRNLFAELTEGLDALAAVREASHASQAVMARSPSLPRLRGAWCSRQTQHSCAVCRKDVVGRGVGWKLVNREPTKDCR